MEVPAKTKEDQSNGKDKKKGVKDFCRPNKFFKTRRGKQVDQQVKTEIDELHLLQGTFKKWIDHITHETVTSYSLVSDDFFQRPCSSSSSSSCEDQKKINVKKSLMKTHLEFFHGIQIQGNSRGFVSSHLRHSDKITMMSGPRPKTIQEKMDIEAKVTAKKNRKAAAKAKSPRLNFSNLFTKNESE